MIGSLQSLHPALKKESEKSSPSLFRLPMRHCRCVNAHVDQSMLMIELANHILFLAQMQTQVDLPVKFKQSLGTVSCEAIPYGYRFRVVQWTTREQAFDQLASDTNNPAFGNAANPSDIVLSGSRIQQGYTSCTPWAMNSYEGNFTFLTCLNSNKISAPPSARQTLKSTSTV
jgi:hypothetical protein